MDVHMYVHMYVRLWYCTHMCIYVYCVTFVAKSVFRACLVLRTCYVCMCLLWLLYV